MKTTGRKIYGHFADQETTAHTNLSGGLGIIE